MGHYTNQWVEVIIKNIASSKGAEIIELNFTQPFPVTLKVQSIPDNGGRLMIALELPHNLEHTSRQNYRKALFELIALQRHALVEYVPYVTEKGLESLAARFPSTLFTNVFLEEVLTFMVSTLQEATDPMYGKIPMEEDEIIEENAHNPKEGWLTI